MLLTNIGWSVTHKNWSKYSAWFLKYVKSLTLKLKNINIINILILLENFFKYKNIDIQKQQFLRIIFRILV